MKAEHFKKKSADVIVNSKGEITIRPNLGDYDLRIFKDKDGKTQVMEPLKAKNKKRKVPTE